MITNLPGRAVIAFALATVPIAPFMAASGQTAPVAPAQPCTTPFTDPEPLRVQTWVTYNDYPSLALRQEIEGRVEARFYVDATGRVESAEVVTTSGHQMLDDAAIKAVTRRGRFKPATRNCQPVPGEYTRWFTFALAG